MKFNKAPHVWYDFLSSKNRKKRRRKELLRKAGLIDGVYVNLKLVMKEEENG
jgi:hypothetical protein